MQTHSSARQTACERCHGQKLACRRYPGQAACVRCIGARTECVERPTRRGRGRLDATQHPANAHGDPQAGFETFDWSAIELANLGSASFMLGAPTLSTANACTSLRAMRQQPSVADFDFDFDLMDPRLAAGDAQQQAALPNIPPPALLHEQIPEHTSMAADDRSLQYYDSSPAFQETIDTSSAYPVLPDTPDTSFETHVEHPRTRAISYSSALPSPAQWFNDLTHLSTLLYSHRAAMVNRSTSVTNLGRSTAKEQKVRPDRPYAVDDALDFTVRFIRLLDESNPRQLKESQQYCNASPRTSSHPACWSASVQELSVHLDAPAPYDIRNDQASRLMLLSCYSRLIDIFEEVFRQLDCPETSSVLLPAITVGSFSLHADPALQVVLIVDLVDRLVRQIDHSLEVAFSEPKDGVFNVSDGMSSRADRTCSPKPYGKARSGDVAVATLAGIRAKQEGLVKRMLQLRETLTTSRRL